MSLVLAERLSSAISKMTTLEVMTDEEFFESSYGDLRRKKGQVNIAYDFVHVLYPDSQKNLIEIYDKEKKGVVNILLKKATFEDFHPSIPCDAGSPKSRERHKLLIIDDTDIEVRFENTVLIIREILKYFEDGKYFIE